MRKAELSGEGAVMEVTTHQPSLGVRNHARTRVLAAAAPDASLAYLELRSRRRHEKLLCPSSVSKRKETTKWSTKWSTNRKFRSKKSRRTPRSNSESATTRCLEKDEDVEVSCAEHVLEAEWRERETTPRSLIQGFETVESSSSTTRSAYSVAGNRRVQNLVHQNVPTSGEMEEFFAGLEKLQHIVFIEKYNFDPVDEHPLPGRYEWVKLD